MARSYINNIFTSTASILNNGKSLLVFLIIILSLSLLFIIVQNPIEHEIIRTKYTINKTDESSTPPNNQKTVASNKEIIVEHSLINQPCRRNTGILVQRMRDTQRQVNRFFQQNVPNITKRWEIFPYIFAPAMDGFRYALQPFKFYSRDEYKYFLEFSNPNSSCNHITLGVGGSWDGEKALRKKYPQCRLLGVDIIEEPNREIVESIPNSRFLHMRLGNETRKPSKPGEPHQRVLTDLLMYENEGRVVDFLNIDVEGAEFILLDVLHKKRMELPVICQFNMEIHYGLNRYGVSWEHFDKTLNEVLEEGHFVILNVNERTFDFKRIFMLNIADEECITKFLC